MDSSMNTTVTMNVTEVISDTRDLDRWNEKLALRLTPNNVILSLYIFVGLFGNGAVFLTYCLSSNLQNQERYFIPILALADLFTSIICSSFGIVWNFMQINFENKLLCIVGNFFIVITQSTSVSLLFIISVQRYLKICKQVDMSIKVQRLTLVIVIIASVSLGVWSTFYFRISEFRISKLREDIQLTGFRCKLVKSKNGGGVIFGATLLLSIVSIMISMLVVYGKIAYKIVTHIKQVGVTISKSEGIERSEDSSRDLSNTNIKSEDMNELEDVENIALPECSKESKSIAAKRNLPAKTKQQGKPKRKRNFGHTFTLMFMLITIVFVVCYITKTILMLLESLDTHFWDFTSAEKRAGVLFLYSIYIVNSIVNPFVYAFLDAKFTAEFKKLYLSFTSTLQNVFCLPS